MPVVNPSRGVSSEALSLQQVADRLGVHYMTVYRYVRHGLLPASKQAGTWAVTVADVERFASGGPTVRGTADWNERLVARMMAGDAPGAIGVVDAALASGASPHDIYLEVLTPALHTIGDRWERGEIGVDQEHIATAVAIRVIGKLGPQFARRGRDRATVLLASAWGDRHGLSTALLADLLRSENYEAVDLGPDVPPSSLADAVARHRPAVVALSLSIDLPVGNVRQMVKAAKAVRPQAVVALGGHAVTTREFVSASGADVWTHTIGDLLGVLDGQRSAVGDD